MSISLVTPDLYSNSNIFKYRYLKMFLYKLKDNRFIYGKYTRNCFIGSVLRYIY